MPRGDDRDAKGLGAFARSAIALRRMGLFVLPCGGDDGKTPLVNRFYSWQTPPSERTCQRFVENWPYANVGVITGKSNLAVVDVDSKDPALLVEMERRFGETPLIARTGSGNYHLWYFGSHDLRAKNLRGSEGIPVEIKAGKTIVIVPPSRNFATGKPYEFVRGGWDDVLALPHFPGLAPDRPKPSDAVLEGRRNETGFSEALVLAGRSASYDKLLDALSKWSRERAKPPLEPDELAKIARSAWHYQTEGRNFAARPAVIVSHAVLDQLMRHRNGANALLLYCHLDHQHRARQTPFAIATAAMAKAKIFLGWTEWRYRMAKYALLTMGLIRLHQKGRRLGRRNEPDQFVLGDRM